MAFLNYFWYRFIAVVVGGAVWGCCFCWVFCGFDTWKSQVLQLIADIYFLIQKAMWNNHYHSFPFFLAAFFNLQRYQLLNKQEAVQKWRAGVWWLVKLVKINAIQYYFTIHCLILKIGWLSALQKHFEVNIYTISSRGYCILLWANDKTNTVDEFIWAL